MLLCVCSEADARTGQMSGDQLQGNSSPLLPFISSRRGGKRGDGSRDRVTSGSSLRVNHILPPFLLPNSSVHANARLRRRKSALFAPLDPRVNLLNAFVDELPFPVTLCESRNRMTCLAGICCATVTLRLHARKNKKEEERVTFPSTDLLRPSVACSLEPASREGTQSLDSGLRKRKEAS